MILYKNDGILIRKVSPQAVNALNVFKKNYLKENNMVVTKCLCKSEESELISEKDKYAMSLNFKLCKNCGLVRIDPYFNNETIEIFYRDVYRIMKDTPKDKLFLEQINKGKLINKYLSNYVDMNNIENIIEIGCGAGGILRYFKDIGKNVVGFDFNKEFIEYGKTFDLNLIQGNVFEKCNRKTLHNSIIIINHVLEHIVNIQEFIDRLLEFVDESTYIYIAVPGILEYPNKYYPNSLWKYFIFAHPWNFDLNSFKYNLLNNKFIEIISEDEGINIIIKKSNKKFSYCNLPKIREIKNNLKYLKLRENSYDYYIKFKQLVKRLLKK